jgi:predicted alpha/beta superfamily hydrolase
MRKIILALVLGFIGNLLFAQYPQGKVVVDHLYSEALENQAGNETTRRVTVYLPPGYGSSEERYPVIYFLHGFTLNDSISFSWFNIKEPPD